MDTLWKISSDLLQIEAELELSGGELTPEIESALEIKQAELSEKTLNYVRFINHIQSEINEAEIYLLKVQDYMHKKKVLSERLKSALKDAVLNFGEIESEYHRLSLRKSESLEIVDEDMIPAKFKTIKQTIQIDKVAIKKAIKAGEIVFGCILNENQNLQIK